MPAPRHLVAVWNPSYAGDGMDAHLRILVAAAQAARRDPEIPPEDVCVYWGQVRSPNRQQRYPYDGQIAALAAELDARDGTPRELHLYLTDYRTLYVCHVDLILRGDDVDAEEQADYAPPYYARKGLRVDWWFRLRDARRLVHDDLESVIGQLARLRNVNYGDRPVSLYGGMVDLPIVVVRDDAITWFDARERAAVAGDRLWAEHDRELEHTGAMARELRENLLGDDAWHALHPKVQLFLASAEEVFRRKRGDALFDFSTAMTCYAKAIEVQANETIRQVVPRLKLAERRVKIGRDTEILGECEPLTLGQLVHALEHEEELRAGLERTLAHGEILTRRLPVVLGDFVEPVRNHGTHAGTVERDTAVHWRNTFMGIGAPGLVPALASVRPKG